MTSLRWACGITFVNGYESCFESIFNLAGGESLAQQKSCFTDEKRGLVDDICKWQDAHVLDVGQHEGMKIYIVLKVTLGSLGGVDLVAFHKKGCNTGFRTANQDDDGCVMF